ncbi:MAG: putative transcriptional regulator [Candidatus Methanocomedens sp.]|nr:MAG: putative transcriptional regulator [ANME-2 cluster archaeon]
MNKEILINQVIGILEQSGFGVSERCNIRPRSFDIAARRNERLLLIKVLSNIDGLKEDTAQEMMYLAEYLEGSALLVGEKTRD